MNASLSLAPNTLSAPELRDACYLKQTALLASHDHLFIWVIWGQQPGDVRQKQGFRKEAFAGPVVAHRSLKMVKTEFLINLVSHSLGMDSGMETPMVCRVGT